jgi:hypothetical protein
VTLSVTEYTRVTPALSLETGRFRTRGNERKVVQTDSDFQCTTTCADSDFQCTTTCADSDFQCTITCADSGRSESEEKNLGKNT